LLPIIYSWPITITQLSVTIICNSKLQTAILITIRKGSK